MQRVWWISPVMVLLSAVLLSAQTIAFEGKHREIDWTEELQLSAEQQRQIDAIEQRYREQRQGWRNGQHEQSGTDCERLQAERRQHYENMRADIQQVLTAEQKDRAATLMRDQHRQMQLRHARDVAYRLDLSHAQKEQLVEQVSVLKDDYEWPLDLAQHDAARVQLDAVIRAVLTDAQAAKWDRLREKQMRKWHHRDSGQGPDCQAGGKADSKADSEAR